MIEHHLEKLVTFVGVVDAGSIRKYAVSKQLSQPGVSQRISGLERLIGLPLLHRSRTGIQLTQQGRLVYDLGCKLIQEAQVVETELYRSDTQAIDLNFGTYDSVAIYLMPAVLREMQKRLPQVRLKLHCDRSSNILKQVGEGALDVGLCVVGANPKRVTVTPLYDDRYAFYRSSSYGDDKTIIAVGDASDHQGKTIASYLKAFGLKDLHQLSAPTFEVAKAMTLAGLGIGVLPLRVAAPAQQVGLLKQISIGKGTPPSFGLHSFGFVTTRNTGSMPETKILLEIVLKELANLTVG